MPRTVATSAPERKGGAPKIELTHAATTNLRSVHASLPEGHVVLFSKHGLAPAEDADGAAAVGVDRDRLVRLAVARFTVRRILGPEALAAAGPRDHLVGHHVLPRIGREHHREAVQALDAVTAILGKQFHDLARHLGVGKVFGT